jgi:hypothetical protein
MIRMVLALVSISKIKRKRREIRRKVQVETINRKMSIV